MRVFRQFNIGMPSDARTVSLPAGAHVVAAYGDVGGVVLGCILPDELAPGVARTFYLWRDCDIVDEAAAEVPTSKLRFLGEVYYAGHHYCVFEQRRD